MGDFSKSGGGTSHGNTAVLQKIKICFQVFPGVLGTDAQRGIAGVPYTVGIGPKDGILMITEGKTGKDGGVELFIPEGEVAVLTIFGTEYLVTVRGSIQPVQSLIGIQQRLSLLGYFDVEWLGNAPAWGTDDKKTALAVMKYQADSDINADGNFNDLIYKTSDDKYKTAGSPTENTRVNRFTADELRKDVGV
jgi:hypothetical protein